MKWLGVMGLILGLLALGVAIFQDDLRAHAAPPPPPPAPERSLKDLALDAGKSLLEKKLANDEEKAAAAARAEQEAWQEKSRDPVTLTYMGLGFLAIVLGVLSWVRRDHVRISGGAISLGLVALAWQYVLIAVAVAVVIVILSNLTFE